MATDIEKINDREVNDTTTNMSAAPQHGQALEMNVLATNGDARAPGEACFL